MKILIVDDDVFLRDMYATKFIQSGDSVESCDTGQKALKLLQSQEFDIVLVDMVMPGMTGVEFLNEVNKLPNHANVKVVMLSNQGEPSDREAAKEAGAFDYIVKAEYVPSQVVEYVHKIMNQ